MNLRTLLTSIRNILIPPAVEGTVPPQQMQAAVEQTLQKVGSEKTVHKFSVLPASGEFTTMHEHYEKIGDQLVRTTETGTIVTSDGDAVPPVGVLGICLICGLPCAIELHCNECGVGLCRRHAKTPEGYPEDKVLCPTCAEIFLATLNTWAIAAAEQQKAKLPAKPAKAFTRPVDRSVWQNPNPEEKEKQNYESSPAQKNKRSQRT